MNNNLKATEVKRPNLFMNKPSVQRPIYSMDVPSLKKKRGTRIGGARASRCIFCSSLMGSKDEVCTACGSTVISPDAIMDRNDVKKRMKYLNVKKGYEGV